MTYLVLSREEEDTVGFSCCRLISFPSVTICHNSMSLNSLLYWSRSSFIWLNHNRKYSSTDLGAALCDWALHRKYSTNDPGSAACDHNSDQAQYSEMMTESKHTWGNMLHNSLTNQATNQSINNRFSIDNRFVGFWW